MNAYLDEIRIQVNKYNDVLIEFIEEFQSTILSHQLNDPVYLWERFKELINRKGDELLQVDIFKTARNFEELIESLQRKLMSEKNLLAQTIVETIPGVVTQQEAYRAAVAQG
jgi:hypothetical protein